MASSSKNRKIAKIRARLGMYHVCVYVLGLICFRGSSGGGVWKGGEDVVRLENTLTSPLTRCEAATRVTSRDSQPALLCDVAAAVAAVVVVIVVVALDYFPN